MSVVIDRLSKQFPGPQGQIIHALQDVSLEIRDSEVVSIVGPSGCGKTTILNILAGLIPPSAGVTRIDGIGRTNVQGKPDIAYCFQQPRLLPWRTAWDNMRFALLPLGLDEEETNRRIERFLEMVDLLDFSGAFPQTLSGGMQQRVGLARAFATGASTLLMDEPFSSVDELTARELRIQLEALWLELRPTILFITHNIAEAVFIADRVVVMSARPGRVVETIDISLPRPRMVETEEAVTIERRILELLGVL